MTAKTILFATITSAQETYDVLQKMIDVSLDCNAVTYNSSDEELVKWLIGDSYCQVGVSKRVYIYPVSVINKSSDTTMYQYNEWQIEQKYLSPADWEFITRNSQGAIVDRTWWGYEDGEMNIGIYIEKFLNKSIKKIIF